MRVLIDTESARLVYYPRLKIVHHELRRFMRAPEIREVIEKGLEVMCAENAVKWLSDDRENGPLPPEHMAWSEASWAPRAIAAGWRFWAVVLPRKVLGAMNMKRRIEKYSKFGVVVASFASPERALDWLTVQH
jgi:hypothetical protein